MSNLNVTQPERTTSANNLTTRTQTITKVATSSPATTQGDSLEVKNNPKVNIKKGLKDGSLEYSPEEKFFFGLYTKEAQYTYITSGKETIGDIKRKFGLSDGAIKECNPNIRDDKYCPDANTKIFFYAKHVDKN